VLFRPTGRRAGSRPLDTYWPPSPSAEAVILELQLVVKVKAYRRSGDVDVLRFRPRIRPQDLLRLMAGDGRDRPRAVMMSSRGLLSGDDAADQDERWLQVLRALGARHDVAVALSV